MQKETVQHSTEAAFVHNVRCVVVIGIFQLLTTTGSCRSGCFCGLNTTFSMHALEGMTVPTGTFVHVGHGIAVENPSPTACVSRPRVMLACRIPQQTRSQ